MNEQTLDGLIREIENGIREMEGDPKAMADLRALVCMVEQMIPDTQTEGK